MIYTEPLFLGIMPSGVSNYLARKVATLGKSFYNGCAGRFSVVEAAVKAGVPPHDVYAANTPREPYSR